MSETTKQGVLWQLLTLAEASDDPAERALVPALRSQLEEPSSRWGNTPDNGENRAAGDCGLLWFDENNEGIENTLPQAIARFKARFNRPPKLIYLPVGVASREYNLNGLRVVPVRNCPPRHAMLF